MLCENGKEFLQVAKDLTKNNYNGEAHFRSAISRAYYATFNCLSIALRKEKVQLSGGGSAHKLLCQCLKNSSNNNFHSVGIDINDLKGLRTKADYFMNLDIRLNKSKDAINDADLIIDKFEKCIMELGYDDKITIFTEMNKYLWEIQQEAKRKKGL